MGDLHHAVAAGVLGAEGVHAELGEIAAGAKRGRSSPGERTLFDSTGTALQDVAAAALVYERAVATGRGLRVALA
jgi:ornithine cyclodeaminase/alanine dehydrogenase-like protein (mu-crystallin family)